MKEKNIAILGLGYVGLPLAVELSNTYKVIGFDVDINRINELRKGVDKTLEIDKEVLKRQLKNNFHISSDIKKIFHCNYFIATVPTPIDKKKNPIFQH